MCKQGQRSVCMQKYLQVQEGEKNHKSRPGRKCVRSRCVCMLPGPHSSFDAFLFSLLLMLILLTLFLCPVCRDFAVLEDHTLAYNLQEQESK